MIFKKKRGPDKETKFCPICGTRLKISDAYCTTCGYSFEARHKKRSKVKWKRVLLIILIIIAIYLGLRYSNNQPLIPDFANFFSNSSQNITK